MLLPGLFKQRSTKVLLISGGGAATIGSDLFFLNGTDYLAKDSERQVYLGRASGTEYVLALVDAADYASSGIERWTTLREGFNLLNELHAELFVEAQAIANWIRSEKFCPRCGSPVRAATFGWGQRCVNNDHELFPRTDPAIIASVIDSQDRLLLGSNATFKHRMYSVLAGFVEAGESLESAVRREIFEESGVRIGEVAYRGSQPWPMPRSLMLGFAAEALSEELVPDGAEIMDLRWFTRAELREALESGTIDIPRGVSIAHALIRTWYGEPLPEALSK
ncbi:NAD(+) diphosphatase [Glutamicibacter sp. NPDC090743]|uniref:NAD(+) diphosphatase n=1 Tax=Glutamicibacter sp. NPDC090743 TaxID=3364001 RepID=UPI00381A76DA